MNANTVKSTAEVVVFTFVAINAAKGLFDLGRDAATALKNRKS